MTAASLGRIFAPHLLIPRGVGSISLSSSFYVTDNNIYCFLLIGGLERRFFPESENFVNLDIVQP